MDTINKIMAVIWQIIEHKSNCAVNVNTIDDKLIVNIITNNATLRFSDNDEQLLLEQLQHFERFLAA